MAKTAMKAAPKKAALRRPAAVKKGPPKNPRGGREALTVAQLVAFYKALLSHGPAWTAVLFLMQLFMGDRADCARQCTTSWLCLLSPKPYINIPEGVNGKTTARKVPIHCDYAKWLFTLMGSPLQGAKGCWPFTGQRLMGEGDTLRPDVLLFPGRVLGGHDCRQWEKAISEKAYYNNIVEVSKILKKERDNDHANGTCNVFDDVDMTRIGTHSLKKSAVTLMRDANFQAKVVGAITGTSPKLVETIYYQATMAKRREAVEATFAPVLQGLGASEPSGFGEAMCPKCNVAKQDAAWNYCPFCGSEFLTRL